MDKIVEYKTIVGAITLSFLGWITQKIASIISGKIKKIDTIESFRQDYDNSEKQHIVYRTELKEDIKEIKEKIDTIFSTLIKK